MKKEEINKLRQEIKEWIQDNLVGKQIFYPDLQDYIQINKRGLKHTISRIYQPYDIKLKAIYQLETLLENSKLVESVDDKFERPEIKKIHVFYCDAMIDKETFNIWLRVRETINGTFFYDHGIVK